MHLYEKFKADFASVRRAPPAIAVIVYKILLDRQFDQRFRWYIPAPE